MSIRISVLRTTVHMVFTRPPSRKDRAAKQWLRELIEIIGLKLDKLDKLGAYDTRVVYKE